MITGPEIKVRTNIPFSAPPNLEQDSYTNKGEVVQDEIKFLVEDLGIRGRIRYVEIQPDPDQIASYPLIFPAGPVLPLAVAVYFDDPLTQAGLEKLRLAFIYEGQTYKGHPNYDELELRRDEYARQRFWYWIDPETNEISQPLFPREATKDITYVVKT